MEIHQAHFFSRKFSQNHYVSFSFGHIPDQNNIDNFIYQDLNYAWIKFALDNNLTFKSYINAPTLNYSFITKQAEDWKRLISSPHGYLLSMNHWIIDWAIKQGLPSNKMSYIGGGINIDITRVNRSNKAPARFCFVGKDFERKNGPLVVQAFEMLHKKHPETELLIAGPNANPCPGVEGIIFLGQVPFSQVSDIFNSSSFFILPSLFEGYGLVFNEALSFGLPCIGNNILEMPYFIQEDRNGYLLKHQNAEELSSLMEKCLGNEQLLKNTWNSRENIIRENSWNAVGKRAFDAIQEWEKKH